jgi:hypothetical protein
MNHRRWRISLVILLAVASAGAAFANKEGGPNRLNYRENTYGGSGGQPRRVERSWHRANGAKVSETLTYGVKSKTFKNAQNSVTLNTGRQSLDRTTEGNKVKTVVSRTFKGDNKGTRTTRSWKTGRYNFELSQSTRASDTPLMVSVYDRITNSNVTLKPDGRKLDVSASKYGKGDDDLIADMTERGKAILRKARAR